MSQTILGQSPESFKKKLRTRIGFCVASAVLTLGLNILFTCLRTDANHTLMLVANICADILCGFFILYHTQVHIQPKMRLYKLFLRKREVLTGTITYISSVPQRYMDMDCYGVTVNERKIFLPANTLALKYQNYTLYLVSNVIVEVAQ